jgi:hypothetical protein
MDNFIGRQTPKSFNHLAFLTDEETEDWGAGREYVQNHIAILPKQKTNAQAFWTKVKYFYHS